MTVAMTGLRQGELIALRWYDVDWSESRGRVADSYVRGACLLTRRSRHCEAMQVCDRSWGWRWRVLGWMHRAAGL